MLHLPLLHASLRTRSWKGSIQAWDPVRRIWVVLTPEEHVRQSLLVYLSDTMQYPIGLMAVERAVTFGHTTLRFDVVVHHRDDTVPWMLIECKSPDVPLSNDTLHQLLQYQSKLPACRYWLLTNGRQSFCADAMDRQQISWLDALPAY